MMMIMMIIIIIIIIININNNNNNNNNNDNNNNNSNNNGCGHTCIFSRCMISATVFKNLFLTHKDTMTQRSKRLSRTSQLIIPGLKPFDRQS